MAEPWIGRLELASILAHRKVHTLGADLCSDYSRLNLQARPD